MLGLTLPDEVKGEVVEEGSVKNDEGENDGYEEKCVIFLILLWLANN